MADILCDPFPIIPPVPLCSGDCSSLATLTLCKIPRNYPRTTAISTLQDAYNFKDEYDFKVADSILPHSFSIDTKGIVVTTDDPCETESAVTARALYSYIDPIAEQEAKTTRGSQESGTDVDTRWVLDYTERLCTAGTTGITKGPSYISLFNAIQEVITPPTVSPGVTPGRAQKGTRIPKPQGECEDDRWVLTYVDGKLAWRCDKQLPASIDCDKLMLTVDLYDRSIGEYLSGDIDVLDVNTKYKDIAARVNIIYEGYYMPATTIQLSIVQPALESTEERVVSGSWLNSYGQQTIQGTIGPLMSDEGEEDESVIQRTFQDFPLIWSSRECYSAAGDDPLADEFDINIVVPDCPNIKAETGVIVICNEAKGVLSIKEYTFTDEYGSVLDPEQSFGSKCDEQRSKTFYVVVTYINDTDDIYILPEDDKDAAAIMITGTDAEVEYNKGKFPTLLRPGETVTQEYKVHYELANTACKGALSLNLNVPTGGEGADTIPILINKDCTECPSFTIESIVFTDANTGEQIKSWDTGCTTQVSRRVDAIVTLAAPADVDYVRRSDAEVIAISSIETSEGVECKTLNNIYDFTPPASIHAGGKATITIPLTITATSDESEGVDERTVTVTVAARNSGTSSSSKDGSLSIITSCGSLTIDNCAIYQYTGSSYVLVSEGDGLSTGEDCQGAGTSFELVLGYQLKNNSNVGGTINTGQIEFKASGSGDWSPSPGNYYEANGVDVTIGPGGVSTMLYSSHFLATPKNDGGKGSIKIAINIKGASCSSTVDINKKCDTSTPESAIQKLTGGNCIDVVQGSEDGELVINSTLKPDGDTIEINENDNGECVISAIIPGLKITEGACISVDSSSTPGEVKISSTLQAGTGISINPDTCEISASSTFSCDMLTEGSYIDITESNGKCKISSTLKAGTGISISSAGVISATGSTSFGCDKLLEGSYISITNSNGRCKISSTLKAGTGISISSAGVISATGTSSFDCGMLLEGSYIDITKSNGKCTIAVNTTSLKNWVNNLINAWITSHSTTC